MPKGYPRGWLTVCELLNAKEGTWTEEELLTLIQESEKVPRKLASTVKEELIQSGYLRETVQRNGLFKPPSKVYLLMSPQERQDHLSVLMTSRKV